MNKKLNDRILTLVRESGCNEYDQRSALGMARSSVETGKPIDRQTYTQAMFARRDNLAEALVLEVAGSSHADNVAAIISARGIINAPYLDPTMNGQGSKGRLLKPGDAQ